MSLGTIHGQAVTAAGAQASARPPWQQKLHSAPVALTGRHAFHEQLGSVLANRRADRPALAVLTMELDGIGQGDDRNRPVPDDEATRVVVARLMLVLRVQDAPCRIGDEAFACMLVDAIDREEVGIRASRLYDAVTEPLQLGGLDLRLQPSIGIAMYPVDGATGARLFRRADAARRRARAQSLGYAFFDRQFDL